MQLPAVFSPQSSSQPGTSKRYLAIILTDSTIQSVLWEVVETHPTVLQHSAHYHYTDADSCVVKTDECLQDLGKESENVNEVIFALQPSWVTGEGLSEVKKPLLQKITKELTLSPVGYVVIPEALVQAASARHSHSGLILVDIQPEQLHVAMVHSSAVQKYETVGRSNTISLDITEAVARFHTAESYLPPHLIISSHLLTDVEVEDLHQQVLAHDWLSTHYFVQQPLIEVLKPAQVIEAIVVGGASALTGVPVKEVPAHPAQKSFGHERPVEMPVESQQAEVSSEQPEIQNQKPKFKNPFSKFFMSPLWQLHKQAILLGLGSGLLALVFVTIGGLWFFRKVEITIKPSSKVISKEVKITLNPDVAASEPENLILKAELVESEVNGEQTVSSSGIKLVGDKATGTVTILNKTDSVKTFDKGTTLSKGNLSFTLDESVTVASASSTQNTSGDGETKSYGKGQAKASAVAIGADSNVTKGSELKIADFSTNTYSASTDADFSGGASREIRVVSEEDKEELLELLTKTLVQQAEEKFEEQSGSGQFFAPTGETEVISAEWSDEVGDEKRELTLQLTLSVEALAYQSEDLQSLAAHVLADEVPEGYALVDTDPELLSQTTQEDENLVLQANISAPAQAVIDQNQLIQNIVGQPLAQAQSTLTNLDTVQTAEIIMIPTPAQWLFGSIPRDADRVTIKMSN